MSKKWYDSRQPKKVFVDTCRDCGSTELQKFTAGGMLQVRCKKCQGRHSIALEMPYREQDVVVETLHGPQTVREMTMREIPAGDALLEHEREPQSFRNPMKNYSLEEE